MAQKAEPVWLSMEPQADPVKDLPTETDEGLIEFARRVLSARQNNPEALPSEALPSEAFPSGALPSEALPSEALSSDPLPSEASPSEVSRSEALVSEETPPAEPLIEKIELDQSALPVAVETLPAAGAATSPIDQDYDRRTVRRECRTANEMAGIILNAVGSIEGVPQKGLVVTVYGFNPWNAMLTITPAAGRVRNPRLWRESVAALAVRLRKDFDVIDDLERAEAS